jgi:hypothetical protein
LSPERNIAPILVCAFDGFAAAGKDSASCCNELTNGADKRATATSMRIEPTAFAALPTMILNDELDVDMMRDIDERAFRSIYRFDFEEARQK